ncbi:MAG: hypothetical protein ACREE2_04610 [Stellaceae bacterium]
MIHRIIEMRRGQAAVANDLLADLAPFLIAGDKKPVNFGDRRSITERLHPEGGRAGYRAERVNGVAAMRFKAFPQLVRRPDEAAGRRRTFLVRSVEHPDKAFCRAILDPLDAGADVRSIGSVKRAVDGAAGNPGFPIGLSHKNHVPMRAFVQVGKVFSPNIVIFQPKLGDKAIRRFDFAIAGLHRVTMPIDSAASSLAHFAPLTTANAAGTCVKSNRAICGNSPGHPRRRAAIDACCE